MGKLLVNSTTFESFLKIVGKVKWISFSKILERTMRTASLFPTTEVIEQCFAATVNLLTDGLGYFFQCKRSLVKHQEKNCVLLN